MILQRSLLSVCHWVELSVRTNLAGTKRSAAELMLLTALIKPFFTPLRYKERMKFYEHPMYKEMSALLDFVRAKVRSNQIRLREEEVVLKAGLKVIEQAGLPDGADADEITLAVNRQAIHVMKQTLLGLHPELADEVRNLGQGHGR